MASHNDITGDVLVSKVINKNFDVGFGVIDWSVKLEPTVPVQLELDFEEVTDLKWDEK
jgi:hypothetical protein